MSIGLGFLLLAARAGLAGARWWQVALRLAIAAGFFLLAYAYFRARPPQER